MAFEQFATGKYTIESLQVMLTQTGLRMAATAKRPAGPSHWRNSASCCATGITSDT